MKSPWKVWLPHFFTIQKVLNQAKIGKGYVGYSDLETFLKNDYDVELINLFNQYLKSIGLARDTKSLHQFLQLTQQGEKSKGTVIRFWFYIQGLRIKSVFSKLNSALTFGNLIVQWVAIGVSAVFGHWQINKVEKTQDEYDVRIDSLESKIKALENYNEILEWRMVPLEDSLQRVEQRERESKYPSDQPNKQGNNN